MKVTCPEKNIPKAQVKRTLAPSTMSISSTNLGGVINNIVGRIPNIEKRDYVLSTQERLENVACDVNSLGVELDEPDRKYSGVTESPPPNGSCLVYGKMARAPVGGPLR